MDQAQLPQRLYQQLLDAARARPDEEVCGLISTNGSIATRCYNIPNSHSQAQTAFEMAPDRLIDAFRDMRDRSEQLWGIYHSHPRGPATPSARDLAACGYPDALQLIITPHTEPPVHAWRYHKHTALPVKLEIG